ARILAAIPPFVTPVGLFVDSSPDKVREVASALGLRHIQLHGNEDADCVRQLERFGIIKAIRVDPNTFSAELSHWRKAVRKGLTNLRGIVLESATSLPGGSGHANDWKTIAQARANGEFDGLPPIIAAGGLTPANVAAVVREIRPWAVDVSSGVEERQGSKSVTLIEQFAAAVRSVD
ncbi:MAG TPA: phosphoribosylanthranilate isomerase, partial [Humisphaera sp.]|nr:phosphoribosylanthranilate isomerase [Humisphaera sp.]